MKTILTTIAVILLFPLAFLFVVYMICYDIFKKK